MKIRNDNYLMLLVIFTSLLLVSCSDDDDGPAIDPRSAFTGNYELEDFDLTVSGEQDTTISVDDGIFIQIDEASDIDEVEFEMEIFISELLEAYAAVNYYPNFDDKLEVTLNEGDFEIENAEFSIAPTLTGEFSIDGTVEADMVEFDFTVNFNDGQLIFEGNVEGSRN